MDFKEKLNLNFEDDFYKEEIRCDYKVTKKLKKIWAVEIDLLNELLRVCKKHNINISVFAGTLLGAVRHNGFIPWDDDLDVCMLRSEYEKLLDVAKQEFQEPYFFQNSLTDSRYFFGYSRLRNSLTTGLILENADSHYNNGIYIDIHVLDGYIENKLLFKIQMIERNILGRLLDSYHLKIGKCKGIKRTAKYVLYYILKKTVCSIVKYEKAIDWYNGCISKYNNRTNRVTLMTHPMYFVERYWCNIEDLKCVTYVPFENIKVPVPENYEKILTNTYGDYMNLPSIEKRGIWHDGILVLDPDIPYKVFLEKNYKC